MRGGGELCVPCVRCACQRCVCCVCVPVMLIENLLFQMYFVSLFRRARRTPRTLPKEYVRSMLAKKLNQDLQKTSVGELRASWSAAHGVLPEDCLVSTNMTFYVMPECVVIVVTIVTKHKNISVNHIS